MATKHACPKCGTVFTVIDIDQGRTTCSGCGTKFTEASIRSAKVDKAVDNFTGIVIGFGGFLLVAYKVFERWGEFGWGGRIGGLAFAMVALVIGLFSLGHTRQLLFKKLLRNT